MSADCEESCGASSSAGSLDILLGRKRSCSRTSHETKERPANIRTSTVGQSAGQQHRCSVIQSPGLPEPSRAVVFPPSHVSASHTIPFLPIRPSAGPLLGPTETRRLYLSIFVDGYLQQEAHASPAVTLQSEQWISPDLPSMQAAVDVVSLLQLNALKHDDRILLEARKRHAAMLRCFRHESQTRQIDLASIIKTMQLMLVGEVYSAVSGGPHAWMQLVSNIVDMVDEQGPSLLLKPFGGMLTKLARICGLVQALIQRKAFSLGETRWLQANDEIPPGTLQALLHHAVRLPELIEFVDMYCSTPHTFEPKAHSLFNELFLLDQKLCGWLEDYYLLTAERFRPLLACTSIESDLNGDKPHFTSFLSYNFHSLYWVCQLLLHSSVLHFSASFPTHTLQAEASSRLAGRYAERLHESLTYALQAANGNVIKASAVRLPLYVLQSWYARSAQDDNAQSCYDLEMQLRRQNPDLEFDALLPWSFITLIWLGT